MQSAGKGPLICSNIFSEDANKLRTITFTKRINILHNIFDLHKIHANIPIWPLNDRYGFFFFLNSETVKTDIFNTEIHIHKIRYNSSNVNDCIKPILHGNREATIPSRMQDKRREQNNLSKKNKGTEQTHSRRFE